MEYICLKCNKEGIKNMGAHLRMAHKMTVDDYDKMIKDGEFNDKIDVEELSEDSVEELVESSNVVTPKDLERNIFPEAVTHVDRPLKDFLGEYDVTEKELIEILRAYKLDSVVSVNQSMNNRIKNAEIKSLELSDGNDVETRDLDVAETLTKKYGFECTAVTSNPKTWVLKKL